MLVATADVFTTAHIAVTAAISGALAFLAALVIMGRGSTAATESAVVGVLTAAAVFFWRKSANLPQLNTDGLHGFSANDWLAPAVTYVWLGVYAHLRSPPDLDRYRKSQAAATIVALAVNVITI